MRQFRAIAPNDGGSGDCCPGATPVFAHVHPPRLRLAHATNDRRERLHDPSVLRDLSDRNDRNDPTAPNDWSARTGRRRSSTIDSAGGAPRPVRIECSMHRELSKFVWGM